MTTQARSCLRRPGRCWPAALALVIAALLSAAGCGSRERLLALPRIAPPEADLSGTWRLRGDFDAMMREIDRAIRITDGVDEGSLLRSLGSSSQPRGRRDSGGIAHVFLEHAETLEISQTLHAMFVSFGRSVVEEYRFGELRMARVGQAVAQRASGWQGADFVVETLDNEGMKITERYRLLESGLRLRREIVFRSRRLEEVTVTQDFRRDGE